MMSVATAFFWTLLLVLAAEPSSAGPSETVEIPAGCHEVGCPGAACRKRLEAPRRKVCLGSYRIDRHEVTVAQYRACVAADACTPVADPQGVSGLPDPTDRSLHPVVGATWEQAAAYCRWRQMRLPTEAEWERAARGPVSDHRYFSWGSEPPLPTCEVAVLMYDKEEAACAADRPAQAPYTRPVCSRPKGNSPEGLCDMIGNAAEWTGDWFVSAAERRGTTGNNPTGPCPGKKRCPRARGHVFKGGGWRVSDTFAAIHTRDRPHKPFNPPQLGFRCAASDGEAGTERRPARPAL